MNDDNVLLAADFDGLFHVWAVETGVLLRRLAGHERALSAFVAEEESATLLSAGQDGTIRLWRSAKSVEPLSNHGDDPRYLQPLPGQGV